ncbi:MAG TPA: pyridoxal phosphate-dependent aminotransferase [Thermoanaerobaculia bacterium]|jgi:alanine-synthesizing transaminase|nr:pyridoxal phosphate-dependent aminotransferase [Thermoanaerobaculia bacterium]
MFSKRAHWDAAINRLTLARQAYRGQLLDLTNANPTKASLPYPLDELSEVMARAAKAPYDPQPLGLGRAREAVAQELACDAADVVITASTSEAYSFLFKLLCDPGDAVLTARPSYPLLEHLAALELIELHYFALEFHRRWEIDPARVRSAMCGRTRAVLVVNPNNPTGSYVTSSEQDAMARLGLPVISDEVFHPFAFRDRSPSFVRDDVLTFTLGGLSKSAGLPHYKLGWIRMSGPGKASAIDALELIADNFLSVATPVQVALPELLAIAPRIRDDIRQRTSSNLQMLEAMLGGYPAARLLPVEGGWSAVIRVPRLDSDEGLALRLIEEHGVVIHPGYFFDFESEGHVVVSLLTEPHIFEEGIRLLVSSLPTS